MEISEDGEGSRRVGQDGRGTRIVGEDKEEGEEARKLVRLEGGPRKRGGGRKPPISAHR